MISQSPLWPHLVVDAVHKKIFVFSYGERGFYERCELDGTGCTSVFTTAAFVQHPRAALHDGKLFAVAASQTAGFDFTTLASY